MCNNAGVLGQINHKDLQVFRDLLWVGALRGQDNTGAASIRYDKPEDVTVCKTVGGPFDLFDRKHLDNVIKYGSSVLIGHNRSKTLGSVHYKNAHPFVFDNVVGCHNGTLTWASKGRMKEDTKFETDSEALYNDMNSNGFEETIKKMDGAWALVWYDRGKRQLNMHRNKERPLYYVIDKQNSTMYWASEHTMLYLVLNRYNIDFVGKVKAVPENTWVKWQVNEKEGFTLDKPVFRQLVAPPFPQHVHTNHGMGNTYNEREFSRIHGCQQEFSIMGGQRKFLNPQRIHSTTPLTKTLPERMLDINKKEGDGVSFNDLQDKGKLDLDIYIKTSKEHPGYYRLRGGNFAFKDHFESLMDDGCVICSDKPIWTEPVKFLKDDGFVCAPCMFDVQNRFTIFELISKML